MSNDLFGVTKTVHRQKKPRALPLKTGVTIWYVQIDGMRQWQRKAPCVSKDAHCTTHLSTENRTMKFMRIHYNGPDISDLVNNSIQLVTSQRT
jgi:hypothetical protein